MPNIVDFETYFKDALDAGADIKGMLDQIADAANVAQEAKRKADEAAKRPIYTQPLVKNKELCASLVATNGPTWEDAFDVVCYAAFKEIPELANMVDAKDMAELKQVTIDAIKDGVKSIKRMVAIENDPNMSDEEKAMAMLMPLLEMKLGAKSKNKDKTDADKINAFLNSL